MSAWNEGPTGPLDPARFEVTHATLVWAGITDRGTGFTIAWQTKGAGFGETSVLFKDGELHCDNECMSRDFIRRVFDKLVDSMTLKDQP